ncbi:ABC transporter ATP-binding protein [Sandaracinus amylolyticus]|uniref:ABC transporter ATP-binding protein n=1 Tax=Sandaracinus amylolyticus TaxID=927083 RepID=UPI00069D1852|nr:ABC transporter transmembrane domain-containing protein [Sandaracinus amylolyticus]
MAGPGTERPRVSIGRLLQLAKSEWKRLAIGTLFLAIGSGASLVYPQAIRSLLDDALGADATASAARIDRIALLMGVVLAVQAVATGIRYVLFTTAGERVVTKLRRDLYARLLEQEIAFFDERRTGELQSRLASDTTVLQNAVSVNISMALRNAATIAGGVAMLLYTSPLLAAIMLSVVPPIALGAVYWGRRLRRLARDAQDALAAASAVAEESLAGIRTVRSFVAEAAEAARYGVAIERAYALQATRIRVASAFMAAVSAAGFAVVTLVLWYGGHLVIDGAMSVGGLTSFLVYTLLVAVSLGALTDLYADLTKASGAAERVFELLDRTPAMAPKGGLAPREARGELRFESVRFAYPARPDAPVLEGMELVVAPGEIVALVGPSGAGKSTIASLVARLYDPSEGRVRLDGHDLRELDPEWLRRQVGTVAQEPILFSTSIADNIRYARPDASDAEVEAAARVANAHEFVSRFPEGYATSVGERGVQLSGGQKQRIAIARAVLKDPRILVLDEATSALDAESEHLVKEALDRLMKGRTTLVIAHRLSTVRDADRVLVIDGGKIVQAGDHAALMAQEGLYRRLVERQLTVAA